MFFLTKNKKFMEWAVKYFLMNHQSKMKKKKKPKLSKLKKLSISTNQLSSLRHEEARRESSHPARDRRLHLSQSVSGLCFEIWF